MMFYVRQLRPGRGANRLPWWQGDRLWLRSCAAIAIAIQGVTGTQRTMRRVSGFFHALTENRVGIYEARIWI